ncbi:MAG: alpha/beta fold hydrolase [bacterium]
MMEELFLKTEDNIKIAINHYKEGKDIVIIICPGWAMTKDSKPFKSMAKDFAVHYDVITMDFRGHGKSSGRFTFSAKEAMDLKTVVDYAKNKYSKVGIIGFSMGGATAIIHTAKHKDIQMLITVSTPCDFDKIENHWYKPEAFIPTFQKFEFKNALSIRVDNPFLKKIKPINIVQDIAPIPILFLAGEIDPTVYPWHAEKLYNKACQSKSLNIFKNNCHAEDLYLQSHDTFINVCNNWLEQF